MIECHTLTALVVVVFCAACAGPTPGPDKQFSGGLQGAVVGAGTGAVTGFQVGAGTGPGAAVGAGIGAVAGGIQGFAKDSVEEQMLAMARATQSERERAVVHEILSDQWRRRTELHPTREIYPADLFFYGDETKLRPASVPLVLEIARLSKTRLPWSRLVIASYVKSTPAAKKEDQGVEGDTKEQTYARHLSLRRAEELGNYFVRAGIEPRRVETRAVIVGNPILVDPNDSPGRYNQAIEIIPLDR